MAKYDVTFICGHEEEIQLYGPLNERERKLKWLEGRKCKECYRKKVAAEKAARPIGVTPEILPELTGSEKQVAWAESLRTKLLQEIEERLTKLNDLQSRFPGSEKPKAKIARIERLKRYLIHRISHAKFYIDFRELEPDQLHDLLVEKGVFK